MLAHRICSSICANSPVLTAPRSSQNHSRQQGLQDRYYSRRCHGPSLCRPLQVLHRLLRRANHRWARYPGGLPQGQDTLDAAPQMQMRMPRLWFMTFDDMSKLANVYERGWKL